MRSNITVLTLGVSDLQRSLTFYEAMGLASEGIVGTEFEGGAVVFFTLDSGLILALYPFDSIARDTGLPAAAEAGPTHTLGHNVGSRDEVDQMMAQAKAAGATFIEGPRERSWGGYTGHFRDPDGHLWEVVWNPDFVATED